MSISQKRLTRAGYQRAARERRILHGQIDADLLTLREVAALDPEFREVLHAAAEAAREERMGVA